MFGYWPSFVPDNFDLMTGPVGGASVVMGGASVAAQHTLAAIIMKDPSPKVQVIIIIITDELIIVTLSWKCCGALYSL